MSKIVGTDTTIITDLLGLGYIPVVSTIGYDDEGNVYNINADTAAAALSGALNAEGLILMSDIKGLLENKDDPDSLIKKVYVSDIPAYVKQGIISGGMIPKIECCKEAIRRGVKKVFITDGRVPHSILIEILSEEGSGTMFRNYGYITESEKIRNYSGIRPDNFTDKTELVVLLFTFKQVTVVTAKPHRFAAATLEKLHKRFINFTGKNHPYDFRRFGVRIAQAVYKNTLFAEFFYSL